MQIAHFSMISKNVTKTRMNSSTRAVYAYTMLFRHQVSGTAWISQNVAAKELGYCKRTIARALKSLIKLGLIAFTNKWEHRRYKIYEIFKAAQKRLNRHTRRFFSRRTSVSRNTGHQCSTLLEHDYSIKKRLKEKFAGSEKVISNAQLNEITKKATESIAKNFRFMGNFDMIKNKDLVKDAIADKIRILSEAL